MTRTTANYRIAPDHAAAHVTNIGNKATHNGSNMALNNGA
jgi:hypothetical protein